MRRKKTQVKKHVVETETYKFILYQLETQRWKVDGADINGSRRRCKFDAWDLQEAVDKAKSLLKLYYNQNEAAPPIFQIPDVVVYSTKNRNWTEATHSTDDYACKALYDWTDAKGLTYWHELTKDTCIEYKNYLVGKNYAYDTIRLYFWILRRASAWIATEYPAHYRDICHGIKINKTDSAVRAYRQRDFLTVHEVLDFMDFLMKRGKPSLVLGTGLQGLCCMQLLEVLRLKNCDVNLADSTVTIQNMVKNTHRIRRIPIPKIMITLLRNFMPEGKEALVIKSPRDRCAYGRMIRKEMDRWGKNDIQAKNFRNTLPTTSYQEGWHSVYFERYMGHVAKTVTEAHYLADDSRIGLLQKNVVDHVESIIEKWDAPADTAILPGFRLVVNE
jgi:integrase